MIEPKILACTTMVPLNSDRQQKLRRRLPLVPDMDRLIDAAMKEGLTGLFYKNFLNKMMNSNTLACSFGLVRKLRAASATNTLYR